MGLQYRYGLFIRYKEPRHSGYSFMRIYKYGRCTCHRRDVTKIVSRREAHRPSHRPRLHMARASEIEYDIGHIVMRWPWRLLTPLRWRDHRRTPPARHEDDAWDETRLAPASRRQGRMPDDTTSHPSPSFQDIITAE